jgi:hypothetical protein
MHAEFGLENLKGRKLGEVAGLHLMGAGGFSKRFIPF